ncbi:MAG TPA: stage II sporulation protein M [Rugosimonospora sp.]|nr:stage II sporulation protein M [Rugosimonospora sp.]
MDLDAFVAEHAGEWRRLEQLSRRRRLGVDEVDEMLALYQRTGTHLSVVRSRSPDPALVARLSRIVLAARAAITGGPAFSWRTVGRFFTETFPLAVFQAWRWWCAVATVFTLLSFALMQYVAGHPEVQTALLGPESVDKLVNQDFASYYSQYPAQDFALQVWTNNAFLTGQCLAAGILIVPVLYLLANNLLNLAVVGGVMIGNGHAAEFFGLIVPHGLLELTAVFVAAGVGLRIGWSWIAPGPTRTRSRAVAETARSAMLVALGLVGVLAVSGLIEAFVTPSPLPTGLRILVGALAWLAFLSYVVVLGARAQRNAARTDLDPTLLDAPAPTT